MKRIVLSVIFLLIYIGIFAQSSSFYFVTKANDTTFCKELKYRPAPQGQLGKLTYTTLDGKKISIKGRDNVPDVVTFYLDGKIMDKIPQKANKPNSYVRFTERVVDGKLKVYLQRQGIDQTAKTSTAAPMGSYRFIIKMPNGEYYKINKKKNIQDVIRPYLGECKLFLKEYTGDYSYREAEFINTIELFNSLCEE